MSETIDQSNSSMSMFTTTWRELREKSNAYDKVAGIARHILHEHGKTSADETFSGTEVYNHFQNGLSEIGCQDELIQKSTFSQYLCRAAHKKGTLIFCEGRKQGYYTQQELSEENSAEACRTENQTHPIPLEGKTTAEVLKPSEENELESSRESDLYLILQNWLFSKGYTAHVVANNRKNGEWGNPDVFGFKTFEFFNRIDVELTTVECKKTLDGWRHWFFEAVSHSRFSDRSYFAFPYPFDEIAKEAEELFQYAEYFGVGLVVLELSPQDYKTFISGGKIDYDKVAPRELYVAPRRPPQLSAKIDFLKGLGIQSITELIQYENDEQT